MALPTTYNTGTATIAANDTTVTGQGTTWSTSGVQAGDMFMAAGLSVPIASVNSNTSITLADAWPGAARNAASYRIQFTPDATRVLASTRAVLDALTNGVLYAIAGLATAADKIAYFTGAGTAALADFTAFARSLLVAANAAAARTTLGLGTAAVLNTGTSGTVIGRLDTGNTWSTTQTIGLGTAAINLNFNTAAGTNAQLISQKGGVLRWVWSFGNAAAETGGNVGSDITLSRFDDAGSSLGSVLTINRSSGTFTFASGVSVTGNPITIQSSSSIAFVGAAAAATRANLGLLSAALMNTGTSGAAVPRLDTANIWSGSQTFSGSNALVIDTPDTSAKQLRYYTGGLARWAALVIGSETGSNVGADYRLQRYGDDGVYIDSPVVITRATGIASFTFPPRIPSFTVSTLPSAAANPQGLAYVSNGTANKRLAISDGTSWRFPDGAIVS
ncbi:hypothetical protein [Rhizobium sp. A37_96]